MLKPTYKTYNFKYVFALLKYLLKRTVHIKYIVQ